MLMKRVSIFSIYFLLAFICRSTVIPICTKYIIPQYIDFFLRRQMYSRKIFLKDTLFTKIPRLNVRELLCCTWQAGRGEKLKERPRILRWDFIYQDSI